jgi:hypothetical protein
MENKNKFGEKGDTITDLEQIIYPQTAETMKSVHSRTAKT